MAVSSQWRAAAIAVIAMLKLPQGTDGAGLGRRRLVALLSALPLPALGLALAVVVGAALLAPEQTAQALSLLALLPEAAWWAVITLIGAVFGLRVQMQEQAFLHDLATPQPPPVAEAASGADAALSLALTEAAVQANPALAAWLAAPAQS